MPNYKNNSRQSSCSRCNHSAATERTALLTPQPRSEAAESNDAPGVQDTEIAIIRELPSTKLILILSTTWIGVFLGAIDSTIISTLSAPISSEFRSLSLLSWLATAYLIANAACQPISGRLTDIFGRGPGLCFCNISFAAGNLICGLAKDQYVMILGRVVAGVGGGGLISIATFLASDLVPLRRRGLIQGILNIWYGLGAMTGGIFGGFVHDNFTLGWRLAFLIQVPPAVLSAFAVFFLVRIPPKQSDKSFIARIDFVGLFLICFSVVILLLGLNSGGNLVPWAHPLPLITIPLSIATFTGFIWWEEQTAEPIIPVRMLADRTITAACFTSLFTTMAFMASIFYVPLYLQVLGNTATTTGLKMLSAPVGLSVASLSTGFITKTTGQYVGVGLAGQLVFILGTTLLAFQNGRDPVWLTTVAFALVGGGFGAMLTTTLLACVAALDHSQQAVVTSVMCKQLSLDVYV